MKVFISHKDQMPDIVASFVNSSSLSVQTILQNVCETITIAIKWLKNESSWLIPPKKEWNINVVREMEDLIKVLNLKETEIYILEKKKPEKERIDATKAIAFMYLLHLDYKVDIMHSKKQFTSFLLNVQKVGYTAPSDLIDDQRFRNQLKAFLSKYEINKVTEASVERYLRKSSRLNLKGKNSVAFKALKRDLKSICETFDIYTSIDQLDNLISN